MAEVGLGILVISVLVISDPDRLQLILDRVHDLLAWLAE